MVKYITHHVILTNLQRSFKEKIFNEEDILNWCQEVESIFIADPDSMAKYLEIPLKVIKKRTVQLPSNIYKLLDVYEDRDNYDSRISTRKMPGVLKLNRDVEDIVYINYIGTPLDGDCIPMIDRNHQAACETYCRIQAFEEDLLLGKIHQSLYFDWKQRFDGMIQGAKGGFDSWDRDDWAHMLIIMGDKIPKIGHMKLAHKEPFSASPELEQRSITLMGRDATN